MKRRGFVKLCAGAVAGIAASPEVLANANSQYRAYNRVGLIDRDSRAEVRVSQLEVGETYLFHYPYVTTPCFLIDLGRPVEDERELWTRDGEAYRWRGGAGHGRLWVSRRWRIPAWRRVRALAPPRVRRR